jgi:hypothetical protein
MKVKNFFAGKPRPALKLFSYMKQAIACHSEKQVGRLRDRDLL